MRMNTKLDAAQAAQIKQLLWNNTPQDYIARRFKISQTTVSRILHGRQWTGAEWPNGAVGAMPTSRMLELRDMPPALVPAAENSYQTDPNRHQRISDAIGAIALEIEQELEDDLEQSLQSAADEARTTVEQLSSGEEPEVLSWQAILDRAGDLPLVKLIDEGEDDLMKKALGMVFFALSINEWDKPQAESLLKDVYGKLKSKNH